MFVRPVVVCLWAPRRVSVEVYNRAWGLVVALWGGVFLSAVGNGVDVEVVRGGGASSCRCWGCDFRVAVVVLRGCFPFGLCPLGGPLGFSRFVARSAFVFGLAPDYAGALTLGSSCLRSWFVSDLYLD